MVHNYYYSTRSHLPTVSQLSATPRPQAACALREWKPTPLLATPALYFSSNVVGQRADIGSWGVHNVEAGGGGGEYVVRQAD